MRHWGTRWRRGIISKNWHWRAAMLARWGNWLFGRGFKTDAECVRETQIQRRRAQNERGRRKRIGVATDVKFTIECVGCGKRFKRISPVATTLGPHKSPGGFSCSVTIGFLR